MKIAGRKAKPTKAEAKHKSQETLNHNEIVFQEIAFHSTSFIKGDNKREVKKARRKFSAIKSGFYFNILQRLKAKRETISKNNIYQTNGKKRSSKNRTQKFSLRGLEGVVTRYHNFISPQSELETLRRLQAERIG